MIIASFLTFLLLFVVIGTLSTLKKRSTSADYLLAGQSVKPWLTSLSAVATNNSGYMFVGMIGYTYAVGLSSIWLMIGWVFGDFVASIFIHKRLRHATEKQQVLSFAGVLSHWHGTSYHKLRMICGLITVIFLGTYAAAQLNAGSKALHILFEWDYSAGAIIGAGMILLYCFAGGIRASIWTDAAQSFVMIVAMGVLLYFAIVKIGGISEFSTALNTVSPSYMNLFASDLPYGIAGPVLFVTGWVFAGFGVVGQPHIMVRFMAMDHADNMKRVRLYYYSWYCAFYMLTICTGLAARLLIPEVDNFDAELALPTLAQDLLPEILVGLILAGLFAATMSTADSQILSCSAAITRDFTGGKKKVSYLATKLSTVFVVLIALAITLFGSNNVFDLVIVAWSALASSFAPLLAVYALGGKPSERLAIVMVCSGLLVMLLWRYLGLNSIINEVASGILAGLLPYAIAKISHQNIT